MKLFNDTCRSMRNLLPLHVGGDLEPGPARRVDEHLHHCLSCFREFRELAAMRQRLGVLAEEQPPAAALENFTQEVMARIALGERGPAAELPDVRRRRTAWAVPLAAAATLLIGVLLGQLAQSRGAMSTAPSLATKPASTVARSAEPVSTLPNALPGVLPSVIPSEVWNGSYVGLPGEGLAVDWNSPGTRELNDCTPLPGNVRLMLIRRIQELVEPQGHGLTPEPDRLLRPRVPKVLPPSQDG